MTSEEIRGLKRGDLIHFPIRDWLCTVIEVQEEECVEDRTVRVFWQYQDDHGYFDDFSILSISGDEETMLRAENAELVKVRG